MKPYLLLPAFAVLLPAAAQAACDRNYGWVCVPVASDVDCARGEGNGPAYVAGPVLVVGEDIYGLDSDDDGYGCEPRNWRPADGVPTS